MGDVVFLDGWLERKASNGDKAAAEKLARVMGVHRSIRTNAELVSAVERARCTACREEQRKGFFSRLFR